MGREDDCGSDGNACSECVVGEISGSESHNDEKCEDSDKGYSSDESGLFCDDGEDEVGRCDGSGEES